MPLPSVYAYRDLGVIMEDSKWKPHRVICTVRPDHADRGRLYAVKFCPGQSGAAAMISEVVCAHLFKVAGIYTLDPVIVSVSDSFALAWNASPSGNRLQVHGGSSYFGTVFRNDVENGPPLCLEDLEDVRQLLKIWVMDSLVGNLDRQVEGNSLLLPTRNGRIRILAADQSDCFCGADTFCGADFRQRMTQRPASGGIRIAESIAAQGGGRSLNGIIDDAVQSTGSITEACALVPEEWWRNSGLAALTVREVLADRANRLRTIINPGQWGEMDHGEFNNVQIIQL